MSNTEITNDDVDSYTSQLLEARGAKPGKLIQLLEGGGIFVCLLCFWFGWLKGSRLRKLKFHGKHHSSQTNPIKKSSSPPKKLSKIPKTLRRAPKTVQCYSNDSVVTTGSSRIGSSSEDMWWYSRTIPRSVAAVWIWRIPSWIKLPLLGWLCW